MPSVTVEGPLFEDISKKRIFVKELSEVASKAYGMPIDSIIVLIKENLPENVGVGGELILDKKLRGEGK